MSLTATVVSSGKPPGSEKQIVQDFTGLPSSYPEGGIPMTDAELGLKKVKWTMCAIVAGSESSTYRITNAWHKEGKLHLLDSATGKEVAEGKDMSKVSVRILAAGY